jgi:hypothetical protein
VVDAKSVNRNGYSVVFSTLMGLAMSPFDERSTAACENPLMLLTIHKLNGTAAKND